MNIQILLIFLAGLIGGGCAFAIGAPMPFLLGGIFGSACYVIWYERRGQTLPRVSRWVRQVFMAIIGAMIGSRFSPDLLTLLPLFWVSALAIIPFIVISHVGSYAILRGVGKFRPIDAYFASLPGGIVDSTALAEEAGADVRVVTAQHFIRIILVVAGVPLLFLFIQGNAVGSLAGESIAAARYDALDIVLILAIALSGLLFGQAINLPVSHMVGPLLFALILSVGGIVDIEIPGWLIHLAQYMIGAALGAQFSGMSRKLLMRGLWLGMIVGVFTLSLGALIAVLLMPYLPADFGVLFISYAPGGLAEMSLIALSLNFNPVVVALHHLARIFLTIWIGGTLARRLFPPPANP